MWTLRNAAPTESGCKIRKAPHRYVHIICSEILMNECIHCGCELAIESAPKCNGNSDFRVRAYFMNGNEFVHSFNENNSELNSHVLIIGWQTRWKSIAVAFHYIIIIFIQVKVFPSICRIRRTMHTTAMISRILRLINSNAITWEDHTKFLVGWKIICRLAFGAGRESFQNVKW